MLTELLSVLLLHRANCQNLHWNATGSHFDNYHKNVTAEYYDMMLTKADEVAEFICRLGGNPPNYKEVLDIIHESENKYTMVDSGKLYEDDDIKALLSRIFKEILGCIEECLQEDEIANNIHNVGIKAQLESMHNDFDLQYRYLNARR